MYLRQTVGAASRHAVRPTYRAAVARRSIFGWGKKEKEQPEPRRMVPFEEIKTNEDLLPPGAPEGTVPTDLNQATGLERLELLGKMQGVDVFDMRPLNPKEKGTMEKPIKVKSGGDEQYVACSGVPVDSHHSIWMAMFRHRPLCRCPECGCCYEMDYIGPPDDPHAHHEDHGPVYEEPKTMADFIKPEYRWR